MCEAATIISAIGVGLSVAGTAYGASQQAAAADAQKQANFQNMVSSNNAFWARNQNARQELDQEGTAQRTAQNAQEQAFQTQRQGQANALQQRGQVVQQENQTAADIRSQADKTQGQLLGQTSGPALTDAQAQEAASRQQSFAPIAQNIQTTTPFGTEGGNQDGGPSRQAFASRLAEAADAVRNYGKQVAQVASYTAPLNTVQQAVTNANTGLMPTAVANQLLQSGQGVRLLPSEAAYGIAGTEGQQTQQAIQSNLQGQMGVLKNRYAGQESVIGLGQTNAETIANNKATAAASDAKVGQSVGSLISSAGNLAAYGGQRFGGVPAGQPSADALLFNTPPNGNAGLITSRTAGTFTGI
jgi:hypothetical protein